MRAIPSPAYLECVRSPTVLFVLRDHSLWPFVWGGLVCVKLRLDFSSPRYVPLVHTRRC